MNNLTKNNKSYYVYLHIINKGVSGYKYKKYYVGITNNIDRRWANNGENYKRQVFYNAIKKYGWKNIKHKILFKNLTKEQAMKKEKEMILKYNSLCGNRGYNVSKGGENILEIRKTAKIIYCIDLKIAFRSKIEASIYTKENESTIYNKCKNYENGLYNVKGGYKYCFEKNIYKYFKTKCSYSSTIMVNLESEKFIPNRCKTNNIDTRIKKSSILNLEKYINYKDRGILKNRTRYMFLKDYLYLFNMSKMGDLRI